MTLVIREGNILSDAGGSMLLVVPVNSFGVHGAGLAKAFRDDPRFTDRCDEFSAFARTHVTDDFYRLDDIRDAVPIPPWMNLSRNYHDPDLLFFPTKTHWRLPSRLEWIEAGLDWTLTLLTELHYGGPISFPLLGCGLGGLRREPVIALLERFEERYIGDVEVFV